MNDTAGRKPAGGVSALPQIDDAYMLDMLGRLLNIPSPAGFTDNIVRFVCRELSDLDIEHEITRRGAIRTNLAGAITSPDRAIVGHIDTLGAMVKRLKDNGRLEVVPVGTWSARFAEGARVTVFADENVFRGTILPLKASGHVYNREVDSQAVAWDNLEIRVDQVATSKQDLTDIGFHVGDFVAIDPNPEFHDNGFINSRHLDDKAGVAAMLAAAKAVVESGAALPVSCHLIFTIAEEVGVGVPGTLHGDVGELVSVDNGTIAPGQNTSEFGVTISIGDQTGPFDYHLTRQLIDICRTHDIDHARDVFKYYRSDAGSALTAGNDLRTALVCFALDGSHGYERTHRASLNALSRLLAGYMLSPPAIREDVEIRKTLKNFPTQPDP